VVSVISCRRIISLSSADGENLWEIFIHSSFNSGKKSTMFSIYLEGLLVENRKNMLSVRLPFKIQQPTSWHSLLFVFLSNGEVVPYFDGLAGDNNLISGLLDGNSYSIKFGVDRYDQESTMYYENSVLYTRPLTEMEAFVLQQNRTLTNGTDIFPHCLCPESYRPSPVDQYLCEYESDDDQISYASRYNTCNVTLMYCIISFMYA